MDGAVQAERPMPAFPIRMLALDLDGTILGHDFRIGDRTAAAIREAVRRGVRVSIATGRMASSAAVYAHQLGLIDPIIGHQGAVVRAMPAEPVPIDLADPPFRAPVGRILRHTPMAADAARDAIAWCLARGLDPHVNDLERIVVWRGDARFEDYSGYLGPEADIVADLGAAIRKPVSKVIAVGDPPRPMDLIDEARRSFAGRAGATVSHPRFLEFVAPGVSKGRAVAWVAKRAGIPMSQVLTAGDALNDIEMIGDAGHGTAMATAPDVVRAAARYVAAPVDDDGVGALIEALVLAPPDEAARNAERLAAEALASARPGTTTAAS
jgi:hydroxymethylpyrimidine pyrophosphatase-like HAD family hydrolase